MEKKNYNNRFSYIRALACIAVIILHTFYTSVGLYGKNLNISQVIVSYLPVNLTKWAVPCFVMVSGALLLNPKKEISLKKIWCVYVKRIFLALLIFGLFFRSFDMIMDHEALSIRNFLYGFYEIYAGKSWGHMWYLYLIIALYLLLPFYRMVAKYSTEKEMAYLLGIYIIFLTLLPLTGLAGVTSAFYIHVAPVYPLYFFAGYFLNKYGKQIKPYIYLLCFVMGSMAVIVSTIFRWNTGNENLDILYNYASIFVLLQSIGMFGFISGIKGSGVKILQIFLREIDRCSFGIYLTHMIVIRWILRYMSFNPYENGGLGIIWVVALAAFIFGYIITVMLKFIPGIKKII